MKKAFPLFLLFLFTGYCITTDASPSRTKHKKKTTHKTAKKRKPAKSTTEYTGPYLKVADPNAVQPVKAGFVMDSYYKFTVLLTVTPSIHVSGAQQPQVHICVEGGGIRNQHGVCIENLANGYGNVSWEANANTKCTVIAYKPDGTKIPIRKDLLNNKALLKNNEFTWEDEDYKVKVTVSKCKVMPNGLAICPD